MGEGEKGGGNGSSASAQIDRPIDRLISQSMHRRTENAPAAKAGEASTAGARPAAMEGRSSFIVVAALRPTAAAAGCTSLAAGTKACALCGCGGRWRRRRERRLVWFGLVSVDRVPGAWGPGRVRLGPDWTRQTHNNGRPNRLSRLLASSMQRPRQRAIDPPAALAPTPTKPKA